MPDVPDVVGRALLSDWKATTKTRSWAALAAHVATYHLIMGTLLLCWSCATAGRLRQSGLELSSGVIAADRPGGPERARPQKVTLVTFALTDVFIERRA